MMIGNKLIRLAAVSSMVVISLLFLVNNIHAAEKIPMYTILGPKLDIELYDPVSQVIDPVVGDHLASVSSLNSTQTLLVYTHRISTNPNPTIWNICVYSIASKTTACLNSPSVEESSAYFDSDGRILFTDHSDGILKKMDSGGTNITTVATPVSPYLFNAIWLSPDRQKIIAVENRRSGDYYTTNYSRLVLMNADGTNRTVIKSEFLGDWNMLTWKADLSKVFYYYHVFNVSGGVYQGTTPHYVLIDIPSATETDLTGSAVGGKDENPCLFTKSGSYLLSMMYHELYNGQTGSLLASRADVPSATAALWGWDSTGDIYFANLDGTNFRRFVESATLGASIGVFRNGAWYLDSNQNTIWDPPGDAIIYWGISGDIPVVGNWNGSGAKNIGVFRNGMWYLDYPGTGNWVGCGAPADPTKDACIPFGIAGDIPVMGNWNGSADGKAKIGVVRNGMWYLDYSGTYAATGLWAGCGAPADPTKAACIPFGVGSDIPVVGNWNGSADGKAKIGVYRNGMWYLDYPGTYEATGTWAGCGAPYDPTKDACIPWGMASDKPMIK